jgi:hypothetical protein
MAEVRTLLARHRRTGHDCHRGVVTGGMFVYDVALALASFRSNTLLRLLSDEVKRRDRKQLDARIRRASFDGPRSIDRGTNPVGGSRGSGVTA